MNSETKRAAAFQPPSSFANLRDTHKCKRKMFPYCHRIFFPIGLAFSLFALRDAKCAAVPEPGDLRAAGKVEFPVSCAPAVQSEFTRGVALLHSFFYEEARRVFTSVAERDPKCAMLSGESP